jgi:proteasome-associated ATPase
MARRANDDYLSAMKTCLTAVGEGAPGLEQKVQMLQLVRARANGETLRVDQSLVELVTRLVTGLHEAQEKLGQLEAALAALKDSPWHPAVFLRTIRAEGETKALITRGRQAALVGFAPEVDPASLRKGRAVFLDKEMHTIMAAAPDDLQRCGEVLPFERLTADGRVVLRSMEAEMVVEPAAELRVHDLHKGDPIRWDRDGQMAFERLDHGSGEHILLEDTPADTYEQLGGLDEQIEQIQRTILLHRMHAEVVERYHLPRKGSILLYGPVGTGKTALARATANWMAGLSSSGRCRFANIKPGSMNSMWFGQTEANYRELFRVARQLGRQEPEVPMVLFFDELEAIGAARGGLDGHDSVNRVDDRVQTAFLAELDGLAARGNVLVMGATNRPEVLDPALLRPGRFGDLTLEIGRPNRAAASQIFEKHLPPDIPYAGAAPGATARRNIIDTVVSRLYAPNGDGTLATITFRDGKQRILGPADLLNGAIVAHVCRKAVEQACVRELETHQVGVRATDVLDAAVEELRAAAARLSPANCAKHLSGLPQDVPVIRIEMVRRRGARPYQFISFGGEGGAG